MHERRRIGIRDTVGLILALAVSATSTGVAANEPEPIATDAEMQASADVVEAKAPRPGPMSDAAPADPAPADPAPGEKPGTEQGEDEASPASDELPGAISGSVALTSNYIDRGVTNSDNDPAIQGTLEYALETGVLGTSVYIGTFASNAKLEGDTDTSHVEIDALFGIRGDVGETGLSWDLGGAYYAYPGTARRDNFDYWEIPLILTYKATEWLEIEFFDAPTPEYQFNTGIGNYSSGKLTFDIANPYVGWQVFAGVGYQYIEKDASGTDWILGTTVTIKGVDFTVAYTDTNYDARACGGNNQCDAKAVFTVGASF